MSTTQLYDTALAAAEKIEKIGAAAQMAFVERDDTITALKTTLVSGQHAIMLGKPGTSKTAIGRYFADAMGLTYFYVQLGPDIQTEDILGPISTAALRIDEWDRAWSGLAVAPIAFADEIGKAPDNVRNIFLGAMQERQVSIGNKTHPIPLHSLWAGTNEAIHNTPAVWDRFQIRCLVEYISDETNFIRMLRTSLTAPSLPVLESELVDLRAAASCIAMQPSGIADSKLLAFRNHLRLKSVNKVSDRRWREILRAAAGSALLNGRTQIESVDMAVAAHMLWDEVSQIKDVQRFVEEECNKELKDYRDMSALAKEFLDKARTAIGDDTMPSEVLDALGKDGSKLLAVLPDHSGQRWDTLRYDLSHVLTTMHEKSRDSRFNKLRHAVGQLTKGVDHQVCVELLYEANFLKKQLDLSGDEEAKTKWLGSLENMIAVIMGIND